jgi:3-oxoacyl-[acyl-carrier protein] reductase
MLTIRQAKAQSVADKITSFGGQAIAVAGDITDKDYIDQLVKGAAEFGGGEIHIIVNNAGYTWDGVVHKMTDKQWAAMSSIHGTAPFQLIRAAAPYFRVKDGKQRNIVGISSTSGVHGNAGQSNYAFFKAGVVGLMKTIAKEWGPGFNVWVHRDATNKGERGWGVHYGSRWGEDPAWRSWTGWEIGLRGYPASQARLGRRRC